MIRDRSSPTGDTDAPTAGDPVVTPEATDLRVIDEYLGLPDSLIEPVYRLVERCFEPQKTRSAFQHTYTLDQWTEMVNHPSFYAAVAWHAGAAVGFTGFETDPARAKLLHPEYFTSRFPGQRIYYCTDLAIHPDHRHLGVIEDICRAGADFARRGRARVVFYASESTIRSGLIDLLANVMGDDLATPITALDTVQFFTFEVTNRGEAEVSRDR